MIYDSTATVPIKNEICSQKKKKLHYGKLQHYNMIHKTTFPLEIPDISYSKSNLTRKYTQL